MYSKIAVLRAWRVGQDPRLGSSVCSVAKKLSATALSNASPTELVEPRMPAASSRRLKAYDVYWAPWCE